jgi:AcrR family transcriptional regulator
MKKDPRQAILRAAMELFARKGFRGTTTRDLATHAEINEAIIFRHFKNKEELYSAILECKAGENQDARLEELERLASANDDEKFFQTLGRNFLEKHEKDTTFLRLLLFSALEGHQLSEMFAATLAARSPIPNYITGYIQRRMEDGAFRHGNPQLTARAFLGMFASFVLFQEILGLKNSTPYDREEVVQTFVSIFLQGITERGGTGQV